MGQEKIQMGKRLKALRKLHGLSQSQVAAALTIDRSTYAYYELGRTYPSMDKLVLLALYYRVSADFLLGLPEREIDLSIEKRAAHILLTRGA